MSSIIRRVILGVAFASLAAWAQTAQINGIVRDASGLAVPGADVKATQTATGAVRTITSGADGSYVLANLPVGPYQLEVAKEGFTRYVQSGVVLQVNSNPTVDIALKVGAVTEQVQVQANAMQIETQATGVGQVIDNQRVLELPLNARDSQQLIILAGSAVGGGNMATNRSYPVNLISVGGGQTNALTYILDGGTHNEPYVNSAMPLPFPDALQEFKVETSSVPAQYGQHSAGAVTAATKSGTNQFHGSAFEFLRNGVLNARNAFAPTRDGLKRNQFGGVVGGPIVTNKLFFFFGDQFTRTRSVPTPVIDIIPTADVLAGDFRTIAGATCRTPVTLKAPFVNNQISPALFSAPAINLTKQKFWPTTTDPCGKDVFGRVNNSNEQMIVGRIDYQQSDRNSIFGRYMVGRLDQLTDFNGTDTLSLSQPSYVRRAHSLVLGDTYLITNSIVSSFRATLIRTVNSKTIPDFFTLSDLGVKGVYYPADYPKMSEITSTGDFVLHAAPATPGAANATGWQVAEDISMTRGAHQIGFGVNVIHSGLNYLTGTNAPGSFTFNSTNTGMSMGDLMLGLANRWVQSQLAPWYVRQYYAGFYLQDTWKVSSHLSVIAGLRWEPYLAPYTKYVQSGVFSLDWYRQGLRSTQYKNAPTGLLFGDDPQVGLGNHLDSHEWFHLAPRLGLAWDPKGDGRMVIRASAGKFYDYAHLDTYRDLLNSPPTGGQASLAGVKFDDPWNGYPGGTPFPLTLGTNSTFLPAAVYLTVPRGLAKPYIYQWNFGIQKQIGTGWVASGSYMGNHAVHGVQGHEGNPAVYVPGTNCVINGVTYATCSTNANTNQRRLLSLLNPTQGASYATLGTIDANGLRSYNGMILSLQRQAAKGVSLLANYTWSHCIDFGATTNTNGIQTWDVNQLRNDRGNCELDRRHNFNLSTVYQTPQFSRRMTRLLASGWQVSGIVRILSGPWLTVASGLDNALTGVGDQHPDVLSSPYAAGRGADTRIWLNPAAFKQPALGTYGNMNAQSILGPGSSNIDMSVARLFKIGERTSIQVRAEAFNVVNHVNPGNQGAAAALRSGVDLTVTDALFGKIVNAADPRIMQVAMKFTF